MAQNFEQEKIDALTKYTAKLVSDHRVYMEESTLHAKKNGYRPTKTLTSADKRRMQYIKVHYETVPWYDLTHGEEMSVFTATTNGARLWKRLATKANMFLRSADLAFLTKAHEMHLCGDDMKDHFTKTLPSGSKVIHRTTDNVPSWSHEYGYGLPMTRQPFSPYQAIRDPDVLECLGVNLDMVGDTLQEERWALHPNKCHHPMGALRPAVTRRLTDGESEWNNGKVIICEICGLLEKGFDPSKSGYL